MFSDEYKKIKDLKKGQMISTSLAEDKTGQKVIIKRLSLKKADDWKTIQLFEREGEVFKGLSHPGIPVYRGVSQEQHDDDTVYYLVYNYIEGQSLQELLDKGEKFSYRRVQEIMVKTLKILEYLHGLGIPVVHRDINPKNIIIHEDQVYLVDFGACKTLLSEQSRESGDTYVGTYGYMPFEQMVGDASPQSDIYALAMTAIHLLTGKHPSRFEMEKMKPKYPKAADSGIVDRVIDRMIEPDPEARAASAVECRRWLENNDVPYISREAESSSRELSTGRVKIWHTRDASFLVCRKKKGGSVDLTDSILKFWRDHPILSIIILSALTAGMGGPLFLPLLILRYNSIHKRWLHRRLSHTSEVSLIADNRGIQAPGQIEPIQRKKLIYANLLKHKNSNGSHNLQIEMKSRGRSMDTVYMQGLSSQEADKVSEFIDDVINPET